MPELATLVDPDAIRTALDTSLTSDLLSDATIQLQIYVNPAVDEILSRYPEAEDATADDQKRVQNALNFLVGAALAPAVPWIKSQQTGDGERFDRSLVPVDELVATLRARADAELNQILDESSIPTMFTLAPGCRGR